ncbi:MAG: gliding motility-associated C-terminal domain-containing protein, partial [Vicingaceae bacterium]|nr:gliding motility-associated C-terminal domain-containing protein [Vicingaceae bacterium]
ICKFILKRICFIILLLLGFFKAQADCASGTIAAPIIESISVLPNGDVVITWLPILDGDLLQYNVWTIDATNANVPLGNIPVGTTTFAIPASDPNNTASGNGCMQIFVQAEMNCPPPVGIVFNPQFPVPPLTTGFVCSTFLEGNFNECAGSVDLEWNQNEVFSNPRHEVFVSIDGAPAVSAGPTTFGTSFSYPGVLADKTYDFYIQSFDNGGLGPANSLSNVITLNPDVLAMPAYNYLYNATVVDSQQVDIQFLVDTVADVTGYNVMRSTSESGPFVTIGSVSKFAGMDTIVSYSDSSANTSSTVYFYQIEIVNETCGFDSNFSNLASTILIDLTSSPIDAKNTITITEYKDWDLGVLRYDVYRALGGVWEIAPIGSLPAFSDTKTIIDDVSEVFDGNGEFCYRVEAISKGSLPAISSSNESCALHDPLLYVPNAFSPGSLYNPEFKPVLTFAEPLSYTFRVYDRWGQVAFETGDISRGWNGSYDNKGKLAETGVYFYVIEFKSASGDDFVKRGTVTVVY